MLGFQWENMKPKAGALEGRSARWLGLVHGGDDRASPYSLAIRWSLG